MRSFALALVAATLTSPALAYTPESGLWWNPEESGTGYTIEIQDNLMVVTVYGGNPNGEAKWYTAAGLLQGNALFEADLLGFSAVQPIGGHYGGRPTPDPVYGRLKIVFDPDDNRRATLTWPNGRSVPIQRHEFYFQRSDDNAAAGSNTLRMLGEWQFTSDLSADPEASFPYGGDVVVLNQYDYDNSIPSWVYEGCRPDNAQDGQCSNNALQHHDATGYFAAANARYPNGAHLILVKDVIAQGRQYYALYELVMGTNDGSGQFRLYPSGANPYSYRAFPVRAFRSASRSFVQDGVGPSKQAIPTPAQTRARGIGLLIKPQLLETSETIKTSAAELDLIRQLEARLEGSR